MSEKLNYLDCWINVATSLFSQALLGEPVLSDALPKPMLAGTFGFAATLEGDEAGRFAVLLDASLAGSNLLGEGADQKAGWAELLREVADAAAGELLAKTGRKCHVTAFDAITEEGKLSRAFLLKAGDRTWLIQVNSEMRLAASAKSTASAASARQESSGKPFNGGRGPWDSFTTASPSRPTSLSPGLELLLDVELEASLRFGAREMPLGEILDLGPGDVVQLDRHINDPVDLIVGDKIVARGEVVLVNGNFGLRVTEVAEPQRRLESIRCLF
ncbi:FliM/FliN family flagellar motor C-terminal domain-containing protein [Acidicapsa acidisoli]|uniref:FliM/FliN family flagellar motor C-terminal domain-containing protein n=1 Tax=Acidicapsa acidisoli TaxID=1615681 RepID=UPI0021DF41D6|nr:FliM/FliN family flagellar motor C-terminal domain-containing protein [Acidicapsa acidisoli]